MSRNPYEAVGFYDKAIATGQHRAIVGGRWDETGRIGFSILQDSGLQPSHHLLDIGAGSLRLGCKVVPYLEPGHYWATDASRALMLAGHGAELADPARLDVAHLVEDGCFAFPGIPGTITHAIAFAVFPHLPPEYLGLALQRLHRFARLEVFLFTVFLAPDIASAKFPFRQPDGVVTHAARAPYHWLLPDLMQCAQGHGWDLTRSTVMLPRGQILFSARPQRG